MFNKASSEGYRKILDGIELKAPMHGERGSVILMEVEASRASCGLIQYSGLSGKSQEKSLVAKRSRRVLCRQWFDALRFINPGLFHEQRDSVQLHFLRRIGEQAREQGLHILISFQKPGLNAITPQDHRHPIMNSPHQLIGDGC